MLVWPQTSTSTSKEYTRLAPMHIRCSEYTGKVYINYADGEDDSLAQMATITASNMKGDSRYGDRD